MLRSMMTSAAALALLAVPALAQDAGGAIGATGGASDQQQARESAMRSAESVGMQDVRDVEGAFALQGTAQGGTPVIMVVGPMGELLAIAAPLSPGAGAAGAEGAAGAVGAADTEGTAGSTAEGIASPTGTDTPMEGGAEMPEGGYMATQTSPASAQMWDPVQVESALQGLDRGAGGQTGSQGEAQSNGGDQGSGSQSGTQSQ